MSNEDQILAVLTEMLELQKQSLANQEAAIEQQKLAIQRQRAHLRLYQMVIIIGTPIIAYMVYLVVSMLKPH